MTASPPYIDHLVWDEWNRAHITKHRVTTNEVEEVTAGFPVFIESYKNRFVMIGPTYAGRMLSVVIGEVPSEPNVYYVFSARSSTSREKRAYDRKQTEA